MQKHVDESGVKMDSKMQSIASTNGGENSMEMFFHWNFLVDVSQNTHILYMSSN